ncbi:MAG: DoxX family protein [Marinobacter sp.]|uniref:DoxX family protein n=1 Tax=Marinobacter sp. TaxID=50741 RepID=UPI00299DC3C9|nr:DoxX family protein [Marinobacter sp.]MDX1755739.1 DoxX family protein [Marinobacter sp.]
MNFFRKINLAVAETLALPALGGLVAVAARVLMAHIFLIAGYGKITGYEGTIGYMESMGVPGGLLPLVIIVEIGGGLALLFGFQARLAALGLAVFSVLAAFSFHAADDMNQQIHFMKNLAMAGGLLAFFLHGAGPFSLDAEDQKD